MDTYSDFLTKSPIVIDNGSGTMKAGLAGKILIFKKLYKFKGKKLINIIFIFIGEDTPKLVFNTLVGRPKYTPVLPNVKQQQYHIGNFKEENRGLLKLNYPMQHGIVKDWNDMDLIWQHIFSELKVNPNEYPIFLTEPALNPLAEKAKMAQHFFESYSTPALFIGVQGVLSLFASGKTTGIVIEIGDGVTQVVPIFEGYYLQHANQRIDLGGRDITEQLKNLLRRSGYSFNTTAEFEIVKHIKETRCQLSPTTYLVMEKKYSKFAENYTLPDGANISINAEKFQAPEILFTPEAIGYEYPSVAELLIKSVQKCDIDLRKSLVQEVVVSGGSTLIKEFPERFISDVKRLGQKDLKMKFFIPPNRQFLAWQGGSILSNLNYFKNYWITKKEYEEEGERILLKKSF
ncbi:hypothetical protein PPERSA_00113 [Pseudocohnilembus persalinus]|uniref:Actin, cytoplasmic n=1 Tax=Pseudocohnilembus persalinus TaxID=266149 RepID=A0A0V0Q906_PSEPJ|nr:hypothetical protein PPERSA_00113 [Pseudocohnilembus persalinus]|eukprot:KRW98516.1 hypothetical protein PPERSA_00113 [Pseudocohnilembus persalinus]